MAMIVAEEVGVIPLLELRRGHGCADESMRYGHVRRPTIRSLERQIARLYSTDTADMYDVFTTKRRSCARMDNLVFLETHWWNFNAQPPYSSTAPGEGALILSLGRCAETRIEVLPLEAVAVLRASRLPIAGRLRDRVRNQRAE